MLGKTHLGIGLLIGAAAPFAGLNGPDGLIGWGALAIGSLAPDLDGEGLITKPSMWLPPIVPVPTGADRMGRFVGRTIARLFGHRGALHYFVVVLVLGFGAVYLQNNALLWFTVGYALHLLADSLTKMGVPALGPLTTRRFGFGPRALRLVTGGRFESIIMAAVWIAFCGLVLIQLIGFQTLPAQNQATTTIFLPIVLR